MGNKIALLKSSIWDDPEFVALHSGAQRLYMTLLSQDDIDLCGVLALRVARWADLAPDTTASSIAKALRVLEERRFVIVDRRTEEVLIRSYVRHAGTLKQPNVIVGMSRHWCKVRSGPLRQAVLDNLPADTIGRVRGAALELLAEPFCVEFEKAKGNPKGNPSPQPFPEPLGEPFPEEVGARDTPTAFPPFRLSASDEVDRSGTSQVLPIGGSGPRLRSIEPATLNGSLATVIGRLR